MATPADYIGDGLLWWHDASQQAGSAGVGIPEITDFSGQGNHLTGGAAQLYYNFQNGLNALGGAFEYSWQTIHTLTEFTLVAVLNPTVDFKVLIHDSANGYMVYDPVAGRWQIHTASGDAEFENTEATGVPRSITFARNGSAWEAYTDGGRVDGLNTPTSGAVIFEHLGVFIPFIGYIYEMFLIDRKLTGDEVRELAAGITEKWNIVPRPFVVCDGNSITFTGPWPALLATHLGAGYRVKSYGVNGQDISDMLGDFSTQIAPLLDPIRRTIYIGWELINCIFHGASEATIKSQLTTLYNNARASGAQVLAVTGTPVLTFIGGPSETILNNVNQWLVDNYSTFADGLIQLHTIPQLSDPSDTTYFEEDGTHLKAAGHEYVAQAAYDAILALPDTAGTVDSVTIDQSDMTLYGGQTQDFSATVVVTGEPNQSLIWTANAGTINASTGLFTAPGGLASGAQSVTVTATSVFDGSKSDTVVVTVPVHGAGGGGGGGGDLDITGEAKFESLSTGKQLYRIYKALGGE